MSTTLNALATKAEAKADELYWNEVFKNGRLAPHVEIFSRIKNRLFDELYFIAEHDDSKTAILLDVAEAKILSLRPSALTTNEQIKHELLELLSDAYMMRDTSASASTLNKCYGADFSDAEYMSDLFLELVTTCTRKEFNLAVSELLVQNDCIELLNELNAKEYSLSNDSHFHLAKELARGSVDVHCHESLKGNLVYAIKITPDLDIDAIGDTWTLSSGIDGEYLINWE